MSRERRFFPSIFVLTLILIFGCGWISIFGALCFEPVNIENDIESKSDDYKSRKKLFVDLGANKGDSLELFYHTRFSHALEDSSDFIAFAFEPNRVFEADLNAFAQRHESMETHILMKAASIRDERVLFWADTEHNGLGSKIVNESLGELHVLRLCGFTRKYCDEIESVDLVGWISNVCPSNDCYISLKVDVEGNEYELLETLILKERLCVIDELHIEWHRIHRNKQRKNKIISALKLCGLTLKYVTSPIDGVPMQTIHDSFKWSDMTFFDDLRHCVWNNTNNGKLVHVTWCDEHYYKLKTW